MDKRKTILESGSIMFTVYQREDVEGSLKVKSVVSDIYRNLRNFKNPVIWINKVYPNNGRTISDVLDEYTKEFAEDGFVMCDASTITDDIYPDSMEPKLVSDMIQYQKDCVLDAYFYNVFFNHRMSRSYNNPSICIYSNDATESFIRENMGGIGKIIKKIVACGKIN